MKLLPLLLLLLLAGCGKQKMGDLGRREPPAVADAYARTFGEKLPPPRDVEPPASPAAPAVQPRAEIVELREEIASSTSQTQQSITGLGANVGKLAEALKLLELNISQKLQVLATLQLNNEQHAQAIADLRADFQLHAKLQAEFNAAVTQQLAALAAGQVGFQNQLQQTSQTVSAGANSAVQITQFTADMAKLMATSFESMVTTVFYVVGAYAGMVLILARMSSTNVGTLSRTIEKVDKEPRPKGAMP